MAYDAESLGLVPSVMVDDKGDISLKNTFNAVTHALAEKAKTSLIAAGNEACPNCKYFEVYIGQDEGAGIAGDCSAMEDSERPIYNRPPEVGDDPGADQIVIAKYEGVAATCPDWAGVLEHIIILAATGLSLDQIKKQSIDLPNVVYPPCSVQ